MAKTKTCPHCKIEKPRSEFPKNRAATNGLHSWCRKCISADQRSRQKRARGEAREKIRERSRLHYVRNREEILAKRRERLKQPGQLDKERAHTQVHRAVASGQLEKPKSCERCGETEFRIEAHHADYSKPLEVEWLCAQCHRYEHQQLEEAA